MQSQEMSFQTAGGPQRGICTIASGVVNRRCEELCKGPVVNPLCFVGMEMKVNILFRTFAPRAVSLSVPNHKSYSKAGLNNLSHLRRFIWAFLS